MAHSKIQTKIQNGQNREMMKCRRWFGAWFSSTTYVRVHVCWYKTRCLAIFIKIKISHLRLAGIQRLHWWCSVEREQGSTEARPDTEQDCTGPACIRLGSKDPVVCTYTP